MPSPDFDMIDEYLLNRLKGVELALFEQQLKQDADLKEAVDERKEMLTIIDAIGDLRMKERIRNIHEAEIKYSVNRRKQPRFWSLAVATFITIVVLGLSIWLWLRPVNAEKLYAAYYEPYALNFGTRSMETEQQIAMAGSLYNAKKFKEALPIFEQVLAANPADSKAQFALGICYLESGQFDQAMAQFDKLKGKKDPLFGEQALWYSAMVKLKQGDTTGCKAILQTILLDEDNYFYEKAKTLLSSIE